MGSKGLPTVPLALSVRRGGTCIFLDVQDLCKALHNTNRRNVAIAERTRYHVHWSAMGKFRMAYWVGKPPPPMFAQINT